MMAKVKDGEKDPITIQDRNGGLVYIGGAFEVTDIEEEKGTCTAPGLYCRADIKNIPINILEFIKKEEEDV